MYNIVYIFKKNRETYYNYTTGEKDGVWKNYILKLFISGSIFVIFDKNQDNLIGVSVTAYSLLVTFSFTALFFLLNDSYHLNDEKEGGETEEQKIRIEKIKTLNKEIFYNISYFNILSIFIVVVSLINLLSFPKEIEESNFVNGFENSILFLYYFLSVESIYEFLNIINRVLSYYEKKNKFFL